MRVMRCSRCWYCHRTISSIGKSYRWLGMRSSDPWIHLRTRLLSITSVLQGALKRKWCVGGGYQNLLEGKWENNLWKIPKSMGTLKRWTSLRGTITLCTLRAVIKSMVFSMTRNRLIVILIDILTVKTSLILLMHYLKQGFHELYSNLALLYYVHDLTHHFYSFPILYRIPSHF